MSNQHVTTLEVEGMACPSCIRHVASALAIDGVDDVNVRLRDGVVVVRYNAAQAPVAKLVRVLESAGYVSRPRPQDADR